MKKLKAMKNHNRVFDLRLTTLWLLCGYGMGD